MSELKESSGTWLRLASSTVLTAVVFAAPLLAGTVHRPAVFAVAIAVGAALLLGIVGERSRGRSLRGADYTYPLLALAGLAMLQLVPLPTAVRNLVDPAGNQLLANAPTGLPSLWPLSLDPTATAREVGTAAAALAVFLLAFHAGATRRRHMLLVKAVAVAGTVGVVIAALHHIFDAKGLYGRFTETGAVLVGPFVNTNHSAQLFELAAFCALAVAIDERGEARLGWGGLAALNAATATATLSRGSLLALLAGGAAFFLLRREPDDPTEPPSRGLRTALWIVVAGGIVVSLAVAMGATPLFDKVADTSVVGVHDKPALWRDSTSVIRHHPAGIGRHAFENVFPAYKTLPWKASFSFVENGPVQMLLDFGWLGFVVTLVCGLIFLRQFQRGRRRDALEAALAGALVAVCAHNLVDFGLETVGLRLPFVAIAGVMLGRTQARDLPPAPTRRSSIAWLVPLVASVGLIIGLAALWKKTPEEFEALWKETRPPDRRRQISISAASIYPTAYALPVLQSLDEPFRHPGAPSPKLAALNRALRLCPRCPEVHRETARAFFGAGLRRQALASWRDTLRLDPTGLPAALRELDAERATNAEIASLAGASEVDPLAIATHLLSRKAEQQVAELLDLAGERGAPRAEVDLLGADLALVLGKVDVARDRAERARRSSPSDPRPLFALAEIARARGNLEEAAGHARAAARLAPDGPRFARQWLTLVIDLKRWGDLDAAAGALASALRSDGGNSLEVHLTVGVAHEGRGNFPRAMSEYQAAVSMDPTSVSAWSRLAALAESQGDLTTALAAYDRLQSLSPEDQNVKEARARVTRLRGARQTEGILR